jgi:ABC-type molybdate transport system ATPase subunit
MLCTLQSGHSEQGGIPVRANCHMAWLSSRSADNAREQLEARIGDKVLAVPNEDAVLPNPDFAAS